MSYKCALERLNYFLCKRGWSFDPVLKMMIDVAVPKVAGAKGNSSSGF
jgi:hypothetical protein